MTVDGTTETTGTDRESTNNATMQTTGTATTNHVPDINGVAAPLAIVGYAAGGVVFVFIVILIVLCCCCPKNQVTASHSALFISWW